VLLTHLKTFPRLLVMLAVMFTEDNFEKMFSSLKMMVTAVNFFFENGKASTSSTTTARPTSARGSNSPTPFSAWGQDHPEGQSGDLPEVYGG